MSIIDTLVKEFPIRKSRKQKEAFRDWFIAWAREQGYTAQATTPRGIFHSTNVVVGDPETAQVTFTAHYDTPAVMPIPNFITPCNVLVYLLYQLLLVPVILATSVLFWAVPRETYGSSSDEVQQKILSWFQSTPFVQLNPDGSFGFGFSGSSYGTVDLSTVGPKANAPYAVMDVTAAETGTIYLRGQSLDHYTGKAWEASNASTGGDTGWTGQSG